MAVEIDYGEFGDLKDGTVVPRILNDIGEVTTNDVYIEIIAMEDFYTPESYLNSGRVLTDSEKNTVTINPEFRYPSVLAHELLHILFSLKGFPSHRCRGEEEKRFPYQVYVGRSIGNIVTHRPINKYLKKINSRDDGYEGKYAQRLSTWPPDRGYVPYQTLQGALSLIAIKQDTPRLMDTALGIYEKRYPGTSMAYEILSTIFRGERWKSSQPISAFNSMVSLLNATNRFKNEYLKLNSSPDFRVVNFFFPIFVSKKYSIRPAHEYFELFDYCNQKREFAALKVIYLNKGQKSQKIAIAHKDYHPNELRGEVNKLNEIIRRSKFGDFLTYLENEFELPKRWLTVL